MALPLTAPASGDITADYEESTDVLYLTVGPLQPVESKGVCDGVDLDYRLDTDEPCGLTVMGYRQYGWPNRLSELSDLAAAHLAIGQDQILAILRSIAPPR